MAPRSYIPAAVAITCKPFAHSKSFVRPIMLPSCLLVTDAQDLKTCLTNHTRKCTLSCFIR